MGYVNLRGEPLDMRKQMEAGIKQRYLDRKAGVVHRKPTVKNGYEAPPGTGPEGETCGTCRHKRTCGKFIKCELRRATWTSGPGTDILARTPACSKWEARP